MNKGKGLIGKTMGRVASVAATQKQRPGVPAGVAQKRAPVPPTAQQPSVPPVQRPAMPTQARVPAVTGRAGAYRKDPRRG